MNKLNQILNNCSKRLSAWFFIIALLPIMPLEYLHLIKHISGFGMIYIFILPFYILGLVLLVLLAIIEQRFKWSVPQNIINTPYKILFNSLFIFAILTFLYLTIYMLIVIMAIFS